MLGYKLHAANNEITWMKKYTASSASLLMIQKWIRTCTGWELTYWKAFLWKSTWESCWTTNSP